MKKLFILLAIFTTPLLFSQSYTLKGIVSNKKTNEPIPFVTILLKSNSKLISEIANEDGSFLIENLKRKKYNLTIDAIGYKSYVKPIAFDTNTFIDLGTIELTENIEALDAVVLRAETSTIKQKIDRVVINVGKDLTSVGTDAASVLNNVQSVSVDQQTGALSLRGNSNVRVLIDGKPTNIPTDQLLKQLPSNAIKNIELITNPSAKYNPEGNSGIINIELVKNNFTGFNGSVNTSASYGRNFSGNSGFNVNYKKGKVNLFANYNHRYGKNNVLGVLERDETLQNTLGVNRSKNHFFKIGTDIDLSKKTSISFFTIQVFNKWGYTNTTEIFSVPTNNLIAESVFDLTRKPRNQNYEANIHHIFDDKKHTLDFSVSHGINKQPETSTTTDNVNPTSLLDNFNEDIDSKFERTFVNLDYAKPITEDIFLELGLEYRKLGQLKNNNSNQIVTNLTGENTPRGLSDFNFDRDIYSAYFNYKQQIGKIGFQTGVRAESYNLNARFTSELENITTPIKDKVISLYPSFFATYDLNKKDQFQMSYSRRVDRPSVRQLTPIRTWGTPLITSRGNPNLRQQFTNSVELKYNRKLAIGNLSFTTFYRRVNNFISRSLTKDELIDGRVLLSYNNFKKADKYGIELSTYLKFAKWWRFNGSTDAYFQKQQGLVQNTNNQLTTIEVDNILFNIRFNNSFTVNKKLSLQFNTLYRGRDENVQRIRQPMFMMGANASYKVLKDKGTITLGVSDIFDTFRAKFNIVNPIRQDGEFNWESQRVTFGFVYNFGKKFKTNSRRKSKSEREAGNDVF